MNDLIYTLGLESWKSLADALLLPPVPLLVLILAGARLMFRRRLLAWLLVLLGTSGIWLTSTTAVGMGLTHWLLAPPPPLSESEIGDLRRAPATAIVVLGGGRRSLAPEYGVSSLLPRTLERLRYGLWLSRQTQLPVAFSGGIAHGGQPGQTEAEIAARIAQQEFGHALRWLETDSRDTRENALRTVPLLQAQGITQIVLVTHVYHMKRALRAFEQAAPGSTLRIVAAPMGMPPSTRLRAILWLPSLDGIQQTRLALHEWLGLLVGA